MGSSVFFYVQHLWGVGHVYRATRVARGLARSGFDVHLVWGGTQIPGFNFDGIQVHFLNAVRTSDASFSQLLNAAGDEFTDAEKDERVADLLSLYDQINPDILMTEAFPFGRRQMRFELLPLLDRASQSERRPLIVSSIRDIMQEGRKEKRVEESNELVRQYFDLVLVHGDEKMIRIEETLQGASSFLEKVRYTGLVVPEPPDGDLPDDHKCDVLVSVGGGAFGQALTRAALGAVQHSKHYPANWLLAAGTELSKEEFQSLAEYCPPGMRIVRHIPNLVHALSYAAVSVSHAGYNTVADVLRSGCASVLYPYTGGRETEQLRRAEIMSERGLAMMLPPDKLTPENLASAVDQAAELKSSAKELNLDGDQVCGRILKKVFSEYAGRIVD